MKDLRTGQTLTDTTAARHLRRMGRRQQNSVSHYRRRRYQALATNCCGTCSALTSSIRSTKRKTSFTISVSSKSRDKKYLFLGISKQRTRPSAAICGPIRPQETSPFFCRARRSIVTTSIIAKDLFYIRTNKNGERFRGRYRAETDPSPEQLESLSLPPGRHADRRYRSVQGLRGGGREIRSSESPPHLQFPIPRLDANSFPEPIYSAFPGGTPDYDSATYRYNYQSFITPPSVYDYSPRSHQSQLLKQQEVLGGYDPSAVRVRAALGHGARRHESPDFDRLQEGFRARRQVAAFPLCVRLVRLRHASLHFPALA